MHSDTSLLTALRRFMTRWWLPLLLFGFTLPASAQMSALQALESLPPAERQQALQALRSGQVPGSMQRGDKPDVSQPAVVIPTTAVSAPARADSAQPQSPVEEAATQLERPPTKDVIVAPARDVEPELHQLELPEALAINPVPKAVSGRLQPFGYDLFAGVPTTFAPATEIPVPTDYVIGPGDTIEVQLFGKDNRSLSLTVDRQGQIPFPGVGPIGVAGQNFAQLREMLMERVAQHMIGVRASVSMGELRSIRVFVLGDVNHPGSYTVSALSTITNALFVSGGIKPMGSLRNIALKRSGRTLATLDLYDLLLRGDTSGDRRLLPGDVIFVPPVGATVGVAGEVRRPAIYELNDDQSAAGVVELAGGVLPNALVSEVQLERIAGAEGRVMLDLNLQQPADRKRALRDGDVLRIFSVADKLDRVVLLAGHVTRPGSYQWQPRMRITDLIPGLDLLLPKPDLNYVVIRRELPPDRRLEVVTVRLDQALEKPRSAANIELQPRDRVMIFALSEDRTEPLAGVIKQLRQQSVTPTEAPVVAILGEVRFPGDYPLTASMRISDLLQAAGQLQDQGDLDYALLERYDAATRRWQILQLPLEPLLATPGSAADLPLQRADKLLIFNRYQPRQALLEPLLQRQRLQADRQQHNGVVTIGGSVRFPGDYPLVSGMRLSQLLTAAGDLQQQGYTATAELTRYQVDADLRRTTHHLSVDLAALLDGDAAADLDLQPFDVLQIKQIPAWNEQLRVTLAGELRFPGEYRVRRGESLRELLQRAGGTSELAYPQGAFFSRAALRAKEQREIERMRERLRGDLAATSIADAQADAGTAQAVAAAQGLLDRLDSTDATGRLVIDLNAVLVGKADIQLQDGDRLLIPKLPQEVSILGEVQQPTSHLYQPGLRREDYIRRSGGMTAKADEERIYVVRANGAVLSGDRSVWFRSSAQEIQRGDTIVVPLDIERMSPLTLWSTIADIAQKVALTAASAKAIGVF